MYPNENSNSRIWPIFLLFFLIILSGVALYFYNNASKKVPPPPTENPEPIDIETKISDLYKKSPYASTTAITKRDLIDTPSLPPELKSLLIPKYYDLSLEKVVFVDGGKGFTLNFKVASLIYLSQQYYSSLLVNKQWMLISAIFNSQTALRVMKTNKYKAIIEERVLDKQNISISITVDELNE